MLGREPREVRVFAYGVHGALELDSGQAVCVCPDAFAIGCILFCGRGDRLRFP